MELELQKEQFDYYRPGTPLLLNFEETEETIVPDYCSDIARIVDVSACLLLRSRQAADGKLTASGSVKLTLLYVAEDAQGLRALEYAVPFEHSGNLPEGCETAAVEGRVSNAEARLLNPRKLFTRLNIEWKITPYCRAELTVCGEIADQEAYAIQMLCERYEVSLVRSVGDKDFVFAEELALPGGREAIAELLCQRVKLRVTESRCLGSKVILKGVVCLSLLYSSEEGRLCSYAEELPFSQILDGVADDGGECSACTVLTLTGSEIHTAEGDGRTVSVKLFLNAFVALREKKSVCCITDLYSTSYDLDVETQTVELWQEPELSTVSQSVREQLDTGTEVKCVLSADVIFGSVGLRQENGRTALRAAAVVSALYLDEADVPLSVSRHIEITAEGTAPEGAQVSVESVCAGDITANINAGGIELRFPAEFTVQSVESPVCSCLSALRAEEPDSSCGTPPLVLRALREGETLWDVSKQYRTTAEEILAANELTESSVLSAGRMLLIPRKR